MPIFLQFVEHYLGLLADGSQGNRRWLGHEKHRGHI